MAPETIEAYGISVRVAPGWNAEIFRFGDGSPVGTTGEMTDAERDSSPPLVHAATVDLPQKRGSYALDCIDHMGPGDAFVALVVDDSEQATTRAIYRAANEPWPLTPEAFDPTESPRLAPNVVFVQRFFQRAGRGMCLFAGVHEGVGRGIPVARVNQFLHGVRVGSRPGP